jgi:O-antigen ligase
MTSSIWWWDEKNSHNDFLTIVVERGLIGLLLFLIFLYLAFAKRSSQAIAIGCAIVITGAVSNGLLHRPLPMWLPLLALAVSRPTGDMAVRRFRVMKVVPRDPPPDAAPT